MGCSYYIFKQGDYYCAKKQDYVNSDVYEKYCKRYDYTYCPIYKIEDTSRCYLTSACVYSKALKSDCYELETLRIYRDKWLKNAIGGEKIISEYYKIAPKIVSIINECESRENIYEEIYENMVLPCVRLIEQKRYVDVIDIYKNETLKLASKFDIMEEVYL